MLGIISSLMYRIAVQLAEEAMGTILAALALATSTALEEIPLGEIEKAYWDCDSTVSKVLVDFADAEFCSRVYERLKAEKFSGDFRKFLEWWNANKAREY